MALESLTAVGSVQPWIIPLLSDSLAHLCLEGITMSNRASRQSSPGRHWLSDYGPGVSRP